MAVGRAEVTNGPDSLSIPRTVLVYEIKQITEIIETPTKNYQNTAKGAKIYLWKTTEKKVRVQTP